MRRTKRNSGFFICLLINMLLNLEWTIPAWILLGLHFWIGLSVWWFVGALAIWIAVISCWTGILSWAGKCSTADKPRENKNPYSAGKYDPKK